VRVRESVRERERERERERAREREREKFFFHVLFPLVRLRNPNARKTTANT